MATTRITYTDGTSELVPITMRATCKAEAHAIDEFQLASRLSYFIWSSMPDDELFALAKQGQPCQNRGMHRFAPL